MKLLASLLLTFLAAHPAMAQISALPPYEPNKSVAEPGSIFAPENLVAWCIVPFDTKKRGPEERGQMLNRLGIKRLAYDYRAEHIPTFDAEVEAMKKHGIEFTAWWFPGALNDEAKQIFAVIERHKITPQLWITGGGGPVKNEAEQAAQVEREAARIRPIAEGAQRLRCKIALYNHGGWFGEPENQIAIIERLQREGVRNVGIVYNFHHGHPHIARFPELWKKMQPHLLAVNLNGMELGADARGRKIINLSEGDQEIGMVRVIRDSGWRGPVGILNHREQLDAEVGLRDNLIGLQWVLRELAQPGSGGEKPKLESAFPPRPERGKQGSTLVPGKFGKALDGRNGGLLVPGEDAWRTAPITVEAWAKLRSAKSFNVIVASDTKASPAHWEIYSFAGAGDFSVFLPGQGGGVRSGVNICDDQWHYLAMVLEKQRVRLFVDGKLAKEQALPARAAVPLPAQLGIGRTVEDGIGCDGLIDDVRISRGIRETSSVPAAALTRDDAVLGLWPLDELPKTAAVVLPEREPLDPAARPLHRHPINRDRIYDFYAKQARDYAASAEKSALLPAFPGLDGGRSGHWGNQTEADWNNPRWNEMDVGSVQAGVFRHADRTVPRAVCVRLEDAAVCFDPETLTWPEAWTGGFVRFGTARFGFLGGIDPVGKAIAGPKSDPAKAGSFTYRGFYRHGPQIVFSYERDGTKWLEAAASEVGSVVVTRERAGEGKLSALTSGGPAQWPLVFEIDPTGGHDYVTGLQHDREGRFYLASGKQGVVRVTPGAKPAEMLATGFRNPDGIGLGPSGEVAVAVQEGAWTPTSMLYEFLPKAGEAAGHYGHGGPKPGPRWHLPPLAYLPRGEDHSSGGQCYVQGDRWGVPAGTLVHFSWGNGTAFLVLRERLGEVAQGTVVPLPGDFSSRRASRSIQPA